MKISKYLNVLVIALFTFLSVISNAQTITDSLTLNGPLARLALFRDGNLENYLDFKWGTTLHFRSLAEDFSLNANRLTIDPNGNVGINTMFPVVKLDVAGVIKAPRYLLFGTLGDSFFDFVSTSSLHFRALTPQFGSAGVRMTIDQTGNVGINTLNPTTTLDVNGTIRADDIIQNKTLVTDLVFESYTARVLAVFSNKKYAEDIIYMDFLLTKVATFEFNNIPPFVTQNDLNLISTKMPNLKVLSFEKANSVNTLPAFNNLEMFAIFVNPNKSINVDNTINMPNLHQFITSNVDFQKINAPNPCKLIYLGVGQNRTLDDISLVANCSQLQQLHLSTNAPPSPLTDITPIYGLTGLKTLILSGRTNLTCISLGELTAALTTTAITLPSSCQ